jgi:hypothetical protein
MEVAIDELGVQPDDFANELFGIWKDKSDMNDVAQYVRNMRQGRFNYEKNTKQLG